MDRLLVCNFSFYDKENKEEYFLNSFKDSTNHFVTKGANESFVVNSLSLPSIVSGWFDFFNIDEEAAIIEYEEAKALGLLNKGE